jgi:hypothetical protein
MTKVLRDTAQKLIELAPSTARLALVALARVVDAETPEHDVLTEAIAELRAAKPQNWPTQRTSPPAESTRVPAADASPEPTRQRPLNETKANETPPASDSDEPLPNPIPPLEHTVPPIGKDHRTVLHALTIPKPGVVYTVVELAGRGPIKNRETLGRLLRDLLDYEMVKQPHGPRSGYAINTYGLQCLSWQWGD